MHPDNTHRELFKSIGRVLAQRRESTGLTQEQVAEVLQIGTEAVSRMERGITMPTIQRMAELADIYGCGIEELVIATSDQDQRPGRADLTDPAYPARSRQGHDC